MWTSWCRRAFWSAVRCRVTAAKTELACTEKAQSIIEQGRRMQDDFIRRLMAGLEEEKLEIFFEVIDTMNENLDAILEGEE